MVKGKKVTYKEKLEKLESDAAERRRIAGALCRHLEEGYSIESFGEITRNTLKRYMNTFKEEFIPEEIELAAQKGQAMWETIGRKQATGDCLGNSRSWWLNMAHRYKWSDRLNLEAEHKGSVAVNIVSYASPKQSTDTPEQITTIT